MITSLWQPSKALDSFLSIPFSVQFTNSLKHHQNARPLITLVVLDTDNVHHTRDSRLSIAIT